MNLNYSTFEIMQRFVMSINALHLHKWTKFNGCGDIVERRS